MHRAWGNAYPPTTSRVPGSLGRAIRMTVETTFVIAGAGLAGAKAAETLRAEGFDGRVVLVGAEHERPYERPPLSKAYLRGEVERDGVYVHDEGFYERPRDVRAPTSEQELALKLERTAGCRGRGRVFAVDCLRHGWAMTAR